MLLHCTSKDGGSKSSEAGVAGKEKETIRHPRSGPEKRLKRKRDDSDLLLLVEGEISKRVGGDGCLECRKNLTQTNETLQQNLVLAKAHMDLLRGKHFRANPQGLGGLGSNQQTSLRS
jgi:hypothetical protein